MASESKSYKQLSNNNKWIIEINREARAAGLSYGQFVAQGGAASVPMPHTPTEAAEKPKEKYTPYENKCAICGETFKTSFRAALYCSVECRRRGAHLRALKGRTTAEKYALIERLATAGNRYGDVLVDFLETYNLQNMIVATAEQLREYIEAKGI